MSRRLENWKEVSFSPKEKAILEAYLDVALKEGVENVTLQKVARQAKKPYATLHYYFGKSQYSLLETALIYVATASEKFIEGVLASTLLKSKANAVEGYIEAKFQWNEKFPKYASLWCYFIYQTSRDAEYRQLHARFFSENLDRMRTLLLLEVGKGTYPKLKNVEELSYRIYQVIMGAMLLSMSASATAADIKVRKQTTLDMVQSLIKEYGR